MVLASIIIAVMALIAALASAGRKLQQRKKLHRFLDRPVPLDLAWGL
jgi:hypothetical protein